MKGQRFCNAAEIIKNVTEELKGLSENGFQKRSKHLHSLAEVYPYIRRKF
jgi:hypothetical protein